MGYGWFVGGGVVLLPPPHEPTPTSSFALSFSLTQALVRDLYACFVEGGDSQAGPLRRVCPAGWACLMSVCVSVHVHEDMCFYLGDCVYFNVCVLCVSHSYH